MNTEKVYLHYSNASVRGPGKVVQNLSKGLESLVLLAEPKNGPPYDFSLHGILQRMPLSPTLMRCVNGNNRCLFGPNLVVLPNELSEIEYLAIANNPANGMVVPSHWVHNLYRQFEDFAQIPIHEWSVGIDTELWQPPKDGREPGLRCLLYFKNRSSADLAFVESTLSNQNIEYRILQYGSYSESDLKEACEWATFGILLTNTESQGIAYMEMLSTNLPLFVYDQPWWNNDGKYQKVDATSVPYFSDKCGEKTASPNSKLFDSFLNKVQAGEYAPRSYILQEHTLTHAAQKYYDLLTKGR